MIFHDIFKVGTRVEWDYTDTENFNSTFSGVIQGYEVKQAYITEFTGEKNMIVDPFYRVYTDEGFIAYCSLENDAIRVVEE